MLTGWEKVLLALLAAGTAAAFLLPILKRLRIILAGTPAACFDRPVGRVVRAVGRVFLQLCTLRVERPFAGLAHVMIFYAALSFDTMTIDHVLEGFGSRLIGSGRAADAFYFFIDVMAVLVMCGVSFFAFRRFIVRPKAYGTTRTDSALIYAFIALATFTYLYFETIAIASGRRMGGSSFLGLALAGACGRHGLSSTAAGAGFHAAWWAHTMAVFAFIAYVPHSKYLHMVAGPFNVLFHRPGPSGAWLDPLDLDDAGTFGLAKASDLTWKDGLDAFACMECGRCQDACPAFAADRPLSPKMVMFNLEKELLGRGGAIIGGRRDELPDLVPETVGPDEIWSCTTCGACLKVCPVEIDHVGKIIGLRRNLVLTAGSYPREMNSFFRNLENNSNPWNIGFAKRADWTPAAGLHVKHIGEVPGTGLLLWTGCFGAFDPDGQKTAAAVAAVMSAAGLEFGCLGTEEKCCGDPARRLGNEYLFQTLARDNMAAFLKYGVRKIVTICPHGYNTLKNEYPRLASSMNDLGPEDKARLASIEVVHHVELLAGLAAARRLPLRPAENQSGPVVYHDPCYLARHNGIIREPRLLLRDIMGTAPVELARRGRNGFCCGAGGGLMWLESAPDKRMNAGRCKEIIESRAAMAVTACPYCQTMLRDGLRDTGNERIEVRDIAVLTAERLVGGPGPH